jgi:hypothetical protein
MIKAGAFNGGKDWSGFQRQQSSEAMKSDGNCPSLLAQTAF